MKVRPVVYIVPLAFLAAALAVGSSLLFRVLVAILVVGVVALLWVWLGPRKLDAEIAGIPDHVHAGESFKEQLRVTSRTAIPKLLLKVGEETTLPGHNSLALINLGSHGSRSWESAVFCGRRGRYTVGPLCVLCEDPFGLFSRQERIGGSHTTIVYPKAIDLPLFRASFSSADGALGAAGRRTSQLSPSVSTVREMVNGDSQEHIHWRSTAHTGKLMVKVFDAERASDETKNVWLVVDMNEREHFGTGEESTEEYCVTAAASLVKKYLDSGMRVGLVAAAEKPYSFHLNSGRAHHNDILGGLALMRARGKTPVATLISDPARFAGDHSTVVVVTPESSDEVVDALRRLQTRGHPVVAVFAEQVSFGGHLATERVMQSLGSVGVQVYIMRRGESLARALDSSLALWYSRYV